jgi:hypothetical protein
METSAILGHDSIILGWATWHCRATDLAELIGDRRRTKSVSDAAALPAIDEFAAGRPSQRL